METPTDAIFAVIANHGGAKDAVKLAAGFGINDLSVDGMGYPQDEKVVGFYKIGDRSYSKNRVLLSWAVQGVPLRAAFQVAPGLREDEGSVSLRTAA